MGRKGKLPELPPGAPGRPPRDRYREQYGLIVICRNQEHQAELYGRFRREGFDVRVVVT